MKIEVEVNEMEACRALDVIIAKEVMGWKEVSVSPTAYLPSRGRNGDDQLSDLPHYSTKIADAWKVAERIAHFPFAGYGARLIIKLYNSGCVDAFFEKSDSNDPTFFRGAFKGNADTAPLAICRCALKAIDKEDGLCH